VKIVIDSYAWIEHFIGSKKGQKTDEILENADEVYTPDIVLAEVARKYAREGIDKETIFERLTQMEEASNITYIDAKLAAVAATCYLEMEENAEKSQLRNPSLFDAVILAMGKSLGAKILTGDQHFKDLPETIWLE
jgi:predicted nucleic acid-binding protein